MSARPPRPVVEVKHRYLAWDKPQFLIENVSKRPETSPRKARPRRDVKLTVSRSADPHTLRHGPGAVDTRLGKSHRRLEKSASTNSAPVIIADLWKPLQIRCSTTQEKVDLAYKVPSRSPSQPALAIDNFNTRQEAQKLLQNSRYNVNQLLKNHRDKMNGSRYPVKSIEPSNTGYRNHRMGEVAGYQIFGGDLPKTSVYNLNERIVSSASNLSSLSFSSIEHDLIDNLSPTNTPPIVEDGICDVGKTKSASSIHVTVDNERQQLSVDKTVDWTPLEADILQPFVRLGAGLSSSVSRPVSSGDSPNFVNEISLVSRANSAQDCSLCPMCRAQAALKAAETGGETQRILEDLGEGERNHQNIRRTDANNENPVASESRKDSHQKSVADTETNHKTEQTTEQGKRTAEETSRSSTRLFDETYSPFPHRERIESYGDCKEYLSHSYSDTVRQNIVAKANLLSVDLKARQRSAKTGNASSPRREFEPKLSNGAIVLKGKGLTRLNRLEAIKYHSPLHATKWYVDGALPAHQTSPRGAVTVSRGAEIPSSRSLPPPTTPTLNHRVPLIIWRKLQQLESPPNRDNRRMEYEYGSKLAGAAGYHGGGATRFAHQQPRRDLADDKLASKSGTLTSSLVIHIPTAGVTPEEVDCPPNSPE